MVQFYNNKEKNIQNIRREISAYAGLIYRSPPKPIKITLHHIPRKHTDVDTDINMDSKENSTYQEGVTSEMYQMPDRSYFQEPPELKSLVSTGKLVEKFLSKKAFMNKILKITKKSSERNTFTCNCEGNTRRLFK